VLSYGRLAPKIQDYGVIGDCRSAALVSRYGSIDWLCWPRFDSPSIFAALLDKDKGGFWSISPTHACEFTRAYIWDSNVLETYFTSASGRATLTDLMPVASEDFKKKNLLPNHELLRHIVCTEGEIEIEIKFCPRPRYGAGPARIRNLGVLGFRVDVGRGSYLLRSSVSLKTDGETLHAIFTLRGGEAAQFSLSYSEEAPMVLPALGGSTQAVIDRSVAWWQDWASKSTYKGRYRDAVTRSALALKMLTYSPSGAIVAAPTTSLPERIGDDLNWDYRYCWLRDASMTIRAMIGLGYMKEAESFLTWLLHATRRTQPEMRILYTVFGEIAPHEKTLGALSGYAASRPVRIGNGARNQLQLDVYGELVEASAQYGEHIEKFDQGTHRVLIGLGNFVAEHWDSFDEGIWEPRSGRKKHTYSRLLCWTAMDRLLALDEKGVLSGVPRERFTRVRDCIRKQIEEQTWSEKLQSYTSTLGGDELDASLLRIPWYGFEKADSPRMRGTYRAIREKLGTGNGLLYRYERQAAEGAFGICGFWSVEYLALGGGTLQQAHDQFASLLKYGNDLGLFAEETDPNNGEALGNFPQGFTHIGLISAALTLEEKERGEQQPSSKTGSDVETSSSEVKA